MEEAKTQENAKLQHALQEMEQQFSETKAMLLEEREVSKKAAEVVPVIREIPVIDTAMMEKLTVENEKLKVRLKSKTKWKVDLLFLFYSPSENVVGGITHSFKIDSCI